jgi:hypothetical protein
MPLETTQQREHRLKKEHDKRMRELAHIPTQKEDPNLQGSQTNLGSIPPPANEVGEVETEDELDGDTSVEEMLEEVIEEITEDEGEDDDV